MTNKINLLLVAFMAIFLFSCAAEEPITSFSNGHDDATEAPDASADAYKAELAKLRMEDNDSAGAWVSEHSKVEDVVDLQDSYLITKFGSGAWMALYIGTRHDSDFSDLTLGSDADSLSTTLSEAENFGEYFDPRKLLFKDSDNDVRMAWAGRVGEAISTDSEEGALGKINFYDKLKTVKHTEPGAGAANTFSIITTYNVKRYDRILYNTDGASGTVESTVYAKGLMKMDATTVAQTIIHDGKKAWGWALRDRKPVAWVSPKDKTTYGNSTTGANDRSDFLYGSFNSTKEYNNTLVTIEDLQADDSLAANNNNFNPKGKIVMGRNDEYTKGVTVAFMIPIVGYNLMISGHDETMASALYTDGLESQGIKSVHKFYMEFDSAIYEDALADGYKDQVNFPHWGSITGNNGTGLTGETVQKFTGILLKMEKK